MRKILLTLSIIVVAEANGQMKKSARTRPIVSIWSELLTFSTLDSFKLSGSCGSGEYRFEPDGKVTLYSVSYVRSTRPEVGSYKIVGNSCTLFMGNDTNQYKIAVIGQLKVCSKHGNITDCWKMSKRLMRQLVRMGKTTLPITSASDTSQSSN